MRHKKLGSNFGRTSSHQKSMMFNLCKSIIDIGYIKTTVAKGKAVRTYLEKLITLAKVDTVHHRRLAFAKLGCKKAVGKLFTELAPNSLSRPGGYLRVLKCGYRKGDAAPMAFVELVD